MRTTRITKTIICALILMSFSISLLLSCAKQEENKNVDNSTGDTDQSTADSVQADEPIKRAINSPMM